MNSDHPDPITEPTFVRRKVRPRRARGPILALGLATVIVLAALAVVLNDLDPLRLRLGVPPSAPPVHRMAAGETRERIERLVPFSVALEAHRDFGLAHERADTLRRAVVGVDFYLSLSLIDDAVYYRVLAGPAADSASAARLMRRLVDEGHRTEAEAWAIRPTEWAYDLGEFDVRESAEARQTELMQRTIPSHIVEVPYSWGPPRYRLYAGAYETRAEAEVLGQLLREAGYSPPLRARTGRPVQ